MYKLKEVRIQLAECAPLYSKKPIRNVDDAVKMAVKELKKNDRETVIVFNLNSAHMPININTVSVGSLDASIVHPREVFKSAILSNAESIILLHNHPSGSLQPSSEDLKITERLKKAGEILGIELLDHIIVGGGSGKCHSIING